MHPTAIDRTSAPERWNRLRGCPPGHRPSRHLSRALGLLLLLAGLVPSAVAPAQNLSVLGKAVRATGGTPGGWELFIGAGRSPGAWLARSESWLEPVHANGRGGAELALDVEVPTQSIWIAVDAATGALSAAAPTGYAAQAEAVDPLDLFGQAGMFEDRRERLELLILRPGIGAYAGRFQDGDARDGTADGAIRIPVKALTQVWPAIGGTLPILSAIEPGDVVVGIDPVAMTYYAFEYPAP